MWAGREGECVERSGREGECVERSGREGECVERSGREGECVERSGREGECVERRGTPQGRVISSAGGAVVRQQRHRAATCVLKATMLPSGCWSVAAE